MKFNKKSSNSDKIITSITYVNTGLFNLYILSLFSEWVFIFCSHRHPKLDLGSYTIELLVELQTIVMYQILNQV
jgi:hypothetical protein